MQTTIAEQTAVLSHTGYWRRRNEDRSLVTELPGHGLLLAVADGMGGQAGGEVAAQLAVETLLETVPQHPPTEASLVLAIRAANARVLAEADRRPELQGMGTTLTVALVQEEILSWGQVGDSRLYLFRAERLQQITTDQNQAQAMVEAGRLTPEEARRSPYRNMLNQCVGCRACRPASGSLQVQDGDLLLLASDGLHGELPFSRLAALLFGPETLAAKSEALVQAALSEGGRDNVTVVLAIVPPF